MQKRNADTTASNRHNNFNLLRLIAAFFVVVSHSFGILLRGYEQPGIHLQHQFIILSDMGLFIFFSISGYLVTHSLLNSSSYTMYLWKRFLRIVPALLVVNLTCIVMGLLLTNLSPTQFLLNSFTWKYLLLNSTLLHNQFLLPGVFDSLQDKSINASIWTITVEVRLYLLLLLAGIFSILKRKYLLLFLFILLQIIRLIFSFYPIDTKGVYVDVYFVYGSIFFAGVLFAIFQNSLQISPIIMLLFLGIALCVPHVVLQSILLVLPIAYFVIKVGKSSAFLQLKDKDFSYGLYLYAFPIQQIFLLLLGYSVNVWVHIILSTTSALILAILSWFYIEKPALQYKQKLPNFFFKNT